MTMIWTYLVIVNTVAFCMYGIDKRRAMGDQWRISESALLGVALIGGSLGALCGMKTFRHKTKHWNFKILVPVFLIIHIGMLGYLMM